MRRFDHSLTAMFLTLWSNRELINASTKREIMSRYNGSVVGILWAFVTPLSILLVYTFVFSVIFQARWGSEGSSKVDFSLLLFAGLVVFNLFSECVNRAPTLVLSNVNFVKKVIFPLEILPLVGLFNALFHALISFLIWFIVHGFFVGIPSISALFLPVIIIPFCFFLMGVSWFMAALGVYLRDISQITGIVTTALLFLSPIFYPASAFPEDIRWLLYINPITIIAEETRNVLFFGLLPNILSISVYWLASVLVAWLGFVFFQKTRRGFADVL